MEKLEALGYLSGSQPVPSKTNVTVHDRTRAYKGLNFYVSGHRPEAVLMDMEGDVLHTWFYDFKKRSSDRRTPTPRRDPRYYWRRAHLFENGDILAVQDDLCLIKLDRNSNLLWAYEANCHHDLQVMEDGTIYVLTRNWRTVPRLNPNHAIKEDFITVLSSDGKELANISILESLENSEYRHLMASLPKVRGDIFHTNTLEVLDGQLAERSPFFRAGNVLVSLLWIDMIGVVDLEAESFVWALTGPWRKQHQPTVLANGNMLLFDNRGTSERSKVLEFDPITSEIEWVYSGTPSAPFYSEYLGSCQRLPNGNTLITESDNGRAFEVTEDKTIVWEFINPHRAGDDEEFIATLFEVIRLEADFPLDWLP